MTTLAQQVRERIEEHDLAARGERLLLAVSGGADSVALLRLLHELAPALNWTLEVAHFDHRLRGEASAADAAWVRALADGLGLPCHVGTADVHAHAAAGRESIEMAARELRHAFLARTARSRGCQRVALGHHADDQAETFYLRLLRGTVGRGIAGLRWSNPSPADADIRLIRPLLDCRRSALREYLSGLGQDWREDSTNADPAALRNRIRRRLLPLLETQFQAAPREAALRWAIVAGDNADLAASLAAEWLGKPPPDRPDFATLPAAVQREVVLQQCRRLEAPVHFDHVETLRREAGRIVTAPAGRRLLRLTDGRVEVASTTGTGGFRDDERTVELTAPTGSAHFGGLMIRWEVCEGAPEFPVRPPEGSEFLDADAVGVRVRLRHWRPGDRFRPLGAPGKAKLQDLFTNAHVPRDERRRRVVAENAEGELFWVEGLRPGEGVRLRHESRRWLRWSWRRESGGPGA